MRFPQRDKEVFIELASFSESSLLARFHDAVRAYLNGKGIEELNSYLGKGVTDSSGNFHVFETDPKVIIAIHERIEQPEFYSIYETT
jgi:hypothetical protein